MGEGVQQWLARIVFCIFLSHRGGKARTIKPKYFKSDPVAQHIHFCPIWNKANFFLTFGIVPIFKKFIAQNPALCSIWKNSNFLVHKAEDGRGTFWCKLENSPHSQKNLNGPFFLKFACFCMEEWPRSCEMLSEIEHKKSIFRIKWGRGYSSG